MSGAIIKIAMWGLDDGNCRTTSDKDGAFTLRCLPPAGDLKVKVEMPGCSTVVRHIPNKMRKDGIKPLMFILQCGDTPVPIKPHKKSPGGSFEAYVGTYRIASTFRDGRKVEGQVTLSATSDASDRKCLCRNEWKLAIVDNGTGSMNYGCWRVKEDGDLQVSFPREGLAFAGNNWTLWSEGKTLTGQGSSWSDTGVGSYWNMVLTPIEK